MIFDFSMRGHKFPFESECENFMIELTENTKRKGG